MSKQRTPLQDTIEYHITYGSFLNPKLTGFIEKRTQVEDQIEYSVTNGRGYCRGLFLGHVKSEFNKELRIASEKIFLLNQLDSVMDNPLVSC